MPEEQHPSLADTLKDVMLYGAFVGTLWSGVVAFVNWWGDKYELFWNTVYGLIVSTAIVAVVWLARRKVESPIISGGPKRAYYFNAATRWTALGVSAALLLFASVLALVYWQDLHGIVSTPELAVVEAGNLRLVTEPVDENAARNWTRFAINKDEPNSPANTAFGGLILDFTKKDSCKYAEVVAVAVVVERYQEFKSKPQEISSGEATETRILEYSASLDDSIGTVPAKLTRQANRSTPSGNPVIADGLPVSIVVAVRGKKEGLYTVRGEIVVRYHGKKETIRSEKAVTLACFQDGMEPKLEGDERPK